VIESYKNFEKISPKHVQIEPKDFIKRKMENFGKDNKIVIKTFGGPFSKIYKYIDILGNVIVLYSIYTGERNIKNYYITDSSKYISNIELQALINYLEVIT
jgi:hypothetical protein